MGIFNQRKDTIEWEEYRPDVLFFKWNNDEIKSGSRLIVRTGQEAIFYRNGAIKGVFQNEGSFDIDTEIVPFLSDFAAWINLKKDSGFRAEVYFVNTKELTMNWGTRQRIMIPTSEVPSGIPVGMNGNLTVVFRDYLKFIEKVAGVKPTYALSDVSSRILGELDGIVAESILGEQREVGLNALVALQASNRTLAASMSEKLDKELFDIGLGVEGLNIISINYPEEVQKMAEKVAGQSFVTDTAKYAVVSAADGMANGDGGIASIGAQAAIGVQIAAAMTGASAAPTTAAGDRFCTKCRKMVTGKFCPDCGTETV